MEEERIGAGEEHHVARRLRIGGGVDSRRQRHARQRLPVLLAYGQPQLLRSLTAKHGDGGRIARGQRLGGLHVAALDRVDMASLGRAVDVSRGSLSRKPRCRLELTAVGDEAKDVISGEGERVERVGVQAAVGAAVCAAVVAALSAATATATDPGRVRVLLVLHVLLTLLNERGVNHQRAVPSAARRGLG